MDWDIDPGGVNQVLTRTQEIAQGFDPLSKTWGDSLNSLVTALKDDTFSVVAVAVSEYAQHWTPTLEGAAKRIGASLTGASNATKAYMEGQEQMAANAQAAASRGEIPQQPTSSQAGGNRAV